MKKNQSNNQEDWFFPKKRSVRDSNVFVRRLRNFFARRMCIGSSAFQCPVFAFLLKLWIWWESVARRIIYIGRIVCWKTYLIEGSRTFITTTCPVTVWSFKKWGMRKFKFWENEINLTHFEVKKTTFFWEKNSVLLWHTVR